MQNLTADQIAAEIPALLEERRLLALELDMGLEASEEHRRSLQRRVALLGTRVQRLEVAVSVARRTDGPLALESARRALMDCWRVTGSLAN